ncbi:MAG: lysozyme inhibitor LprI family protein [Gemmatimonadota bacterium]|nr:lysozyme inhibitor LprI family protein [Gemmatimonadota bacterium]
MRALALALLLGSAAAPAAAQEFRENLPHPCQDFWMLTRREILDCLMRDYQAADAELNRVYRQVMTRLPADRRGALLVEQRAWLRRYDAVLTSYYSRPWANRSRVKVLPSQIRALRDRTAYLRREWLRG